MVGNYVAYAKGLLVVELGTEYGCPDELLDLYTLLALTRGQDCSLEDVHDAWSVWTARLEPRHNSLVPFDQLSLSVQEMDKAYCEAIRSTAACITREKSEV